MGSAVEGPVNVGSGSAMRVRDFIETAAALLPDPLTLEFAADSSNAGQVPLIVAETRRLTEEVGFSPRY
jgi:UDP-glucose 4-epimerase